MVSVSEPQIPVNQRVVTMSIHIAETDLRKAGWKTMHEVFEVLSGLRVELEGRIEKALVQTSAR